MEKFRENTVWHVYKPCKALEPPIELSDVPTPVIVYLLWLQ